MIGEEEAGWGVGVEVGLGLKGGCCEIVIGHLGVQVCLNI